MSELNTRNNTQSGNAAIIALLVLVVAALGAGAYIYKDKLDLDANAATTAESASASQPASGETAAAENPAAQAPQIKEGNPVVAKVGDDEIKRADVIQYIQTAMPNTRQIQPQAFTMATVNLVNAKLIEQKAANANIDNDPEVKKQLAAAKEQIVKAAFVQKQIDEKLTDARIKETYEQFKAGYPEVKERKSAHILVKDEATAEEVLKKLKSGEDFAALAKEYSIDPTKENGGELGQYVAEGDQVLPEYIGALFKAKPNTLIEEPVKSAAGYHIIKVEDERTRPVPAYEEAKPFIAAQLRGAVMEEVLQEWRKEANVEVYDINGDAFEPASGEAAQPAEEDKAAE